MAHGTAPATFLLRFHYYNYARARSMECARYFTPILTHESTSYASCGGNFGKGRAELFKSW